MNGNCKIICDDKIMTMCTFLYKNLKYVNGRNSLKTEISMK